MLVSSCLFVLGRLKVITPPRSTLTSALLAFYWIWISWPMSGLVSWWLMVSVRRWLCSFTIHYCALSHGWQLKDFISTWCWSKCSTSMSNTTYRNWLWWVGVSIGSFIHFLFNNRYFTHLTSVGPVEYFFLKSTGWIGAWCQLGIGTPKHSTIMKPMYVPFLKLVAVIKL